MSSRKRRYARNLATFLALLALAGWFGPRFFSVEHYRPRLQGALERALGRPVTFGSISLHILPHLGFTIGNVVVGEIPAFGSEPFARADRLDCDLRWRSLWQSRLNISRLFLEDASFNLVRDVGGEWNIEGLLLRNAQGSPGSPAGESQEAPPGLDVLVRDARLNFKIGEDKKPFAITDVKGDVHLALASKQIRFRLSGNPERTDLPFPTPGTVELDGDWIPAGLPGSGLRATLAARGALLYDWIPLVSGRNPGLYGVLDAVIRLTGSLRDVHFDGSGRLTQLHRWEELPPSNPLPCALHFRGEFDRGRGEVAFAGLDLAFGNSQIHLAGAMDQIPSADNLDLVVTIERSRLEDLADLFQHLTGKQEEGKISGRVNGMIAIQGPWAGPRYGGFVSAREILLNTPAGTFPISEVALRIDRRGARLAPVRVLLAPHVEALVEGSVRRLPPLGTSHLKSGPPAYNLTLSARSVPLHDLLRFARGIGLETVRNLDAQGAASLSVRLSGTARPFTRPEVSAQGTLQSARLLVPGLTEPLNVPRAKVEVEGTKVVADPVVAVIGTSVFSGRVAHQGPRQAPWKFNVRASQLNLGEGARWFDILGEQQPVPLLQRLPGVQSLIERREAASSLFDRLNAEGQFSTALLTYRKLTLHRFHSLVLIRGRVIQISNAAFFAGGGRGAGKAVIDLRERPSRLSADLSLAGAGIGALAPVLPANLRAARGTYSAQGHFETRGLSRSEITSNLRGTATVELWKVVLGGFDPLRILARYSGAGTLEPASGPSVIDAGRARFVLFDQRLLMQDASLNLRGAKLALKGSYAYDGQIRLNVQADLRNLQRPWASGEKGEISGARLARLQFIGTLNGLAKGPDLTLTRPDR